MIIIMAKSRLINIMLKIERMIFKLVHFGIPANESIGSENPSTNSIRIPKRSPNPIKLVINFLSCNWVSFLIKYLIKKAITINKIIMPTASLISADLTMRAS